MWSDFCSPLATGLTELYCNLKLSVLIVFRIFVPHRGENEFELLPTKQNSGSYILGVMYTIYNKHQASL